MNESDSELIKAAKLLVAETKAYIAAIKKGIEQDHLRLEEQQKNLAKNLADLRRLETQKPFTTE